MTPHRLPTGIPEHLLRWLDPGDQLAMAEQERRSPPWRAGFDAILADPHDLMAKMIYGLSYWQLPPEAKARVEEAMRRPVEVTP